LFLLRSQNLNCIKIDFVEEFRKFLTHEYSWGGGARLAHLFSFLCCVVLLCIVFLYPVSCVLNVACVSGLPILYCLFYFFNVYLSCVLGTLCCQYFSIVHSWLSILDCPSFIAPSVFLYCLLYSVLWCWWSLYVHHTMIIK
jgi:hypothetical protein